ncbi:signal peptide peptidase-like protein [Haematococcus lacustris]
MWEESGDALRAYGVLAGVLCLGALDWPVLRSGGSADLLYFISLAVTTQYIGAHRSLTTKQRQQVSIKEGLLAPLAASVSLFSCYLIVRFLPQLSISTLLNAYFWLLGCFAGTGALSPILRQVAGPLGERRLGLDVPEGWLLDAEGKAMTRAEFSPSDVLAVAAALGLSTAQLLSQEFSLNNLMACLIATDILQLIGIRSFRVAGAMLAGLLLYDVFWVFASPSVVGDNVMLTVATSDLITGPSRLLFPRAPGGVGEASDFPFSLLGLGDIAIPGLLACLALRFDASRAADDDGRVALAGTGEAPENTGASAARLPHPAPAHSSSEHTSRGAGAHSSTPQAVLLSHERSRTPGSSVAASEDPASSQPHLGADGSKNGSSSEEQSPRPSTPKPVSSAVLSQRTYFTPTMVAYVAGLLLAFIANSLTGKGQPALLYIVPATLSALVATGAARGELPQLWSWSDVASFGLPEVPRDSDAPGAKRR